MSEDHFEIWLRYCARHDESIAQRHAEFMANMARIGPPLGFAGMKLPPTPDCGAELVALYHARYPVRGLWIEGEYLYRGERYVYKDRSGYDDLVRIVFKPTNPALDFRAILHDHLPQVTAAYRAYRMDAGQGFYGTNYCGGVGRTNPVYNRLRHDPVIDVDGRNNIYVLESAQYWDGELCRRALGYGPDEVIRRLQSEAPFVAPLLDGVYLVLSDDPQLTYDQFVSMNERYKEILGLI